MTAPTETSAYRSISGWVPLALAAAALLFLGGWVLTGPHAPNLVAEHGVVREDEGVAAHVWQLLMLAQLLAIAVFAARWLPRAPRSAAVMLGLQALGIVAAALPVALWAS